MKRKPKLITKVDLTLLTKIFEKIEIERNKVLARVTEIERQYTEEVRIVRPGPKAAALKALMASLGEKLNSFDEDNRPELERLNSEKLRLTEELDKELAKNEEVANGLDGLLERIKLAHKIAGTWITLFITLLFVVIELTPIFFKMMLIKSSL